MFGNPERGITAGETSGALDQDKRVQGVRVQSMLLQERSANLRLEGRKREIAMGITRDNELHRRRTEMTDAIKENNGVVGLHASAPPSSHTPALSGICETSYLSPSKPSNLSTALSFTKICTKPDCWRTSTHRAGSSPGTPIVRPDFDTNRYILTGVRGRGSLNCKALWISCLDTWPKILDTYMAKIDLKCS